MGGPSRMYYRLVGDFPQCEDLRYQVWRLLSYQLVHKGYVHLLSNCVSLVRADPLSHPFRVLICRHK
jgi:membrane associated rhomboid family serine protease